MGSDARALARSLVITAVLTTAAFGLPARAFTPDGPPGLRVSVRAVPAGAAGSAGMAQVRLPFPPTHVGIRWRGSGAAVVELRWLVAGVWGSWERPPIWDDAGDAAAGLVASGLVRPTPGATLVGLRWTAGAGQLEVVSIDAGSDPVRPATTAGVARTGRVPVAGGQPAEPPVITRHDWGANEGLRKGHPEFAPISKLIVHHTVTQNNDPDPAQTVRAIYAYHTRGNGWNDIGYNFLVDQQGRVYEGRFARRYGPGETATGEDEAGRGVIGAHAKEVNPGTVGVALLGDFSGGFAPPGPQLDGLVRILAWKAARHDIDPKGASPFTAANGSRRTFPNIAGHRDVGETGCPGGRLYERLPEVRQRVADTIGAPPAAPPPPPPPAPIPVPVPAFPGFWATTATGRIEAFGDVRSAGDLAGLALGGPIVSMAATPGGHGYWLLGADGGVFGFGDAPFLGAPAGRLHGPAVDLEPTPTGKGYWVLSAAGEVVAYGDALFAGQTFPLPLPAVGLAATPSGRGYWIATADARVVPFGDAVLRAATGGPVAAVTGSVAGTAGVGPAGRPAAPGTPVVAIAASPDGTGYWLLTGDGGVFSFGVPFHGSVPDRRPYGGAVDLQATPSGAGYYVAGADGAVFAFGDADQRRERPAGSGPVVDVAFRPTGPVNPDRWPGLPTGPPAPG